MAIRFAMFRVNLTEALYGRPWRQGAHRKGIPARELIAALRREHVGFLGAPLSA